jgi:hypothetical protein
MEVKNINTTGIRNKWLIYSSVNVTTWSFSTSKEHQRGFQLDEKLTTASSITLSSPWSNYQGSKFPNFRLPLKVRMYQDIEKMRQK